MACLNLCLHIEALDSHIYSPFHSGRNRKCTTQYVTFICCLIGLVRFPYKPLDGGIQECLQRGVTLKRLTTMCLRAKAKHLASAKHSQRLDKGYTVAHTLNKTVAKA